MLLLLPLTFASRLSMPFSSATDSAQASPQQQQQDCCHQQQQAYEFDSNSSEDLSSLYVMRRTRSSIRSISSTAAEDEWAERLNVKKALGDLKTNIEAMDAEREELNASLALEREKAAIEMALNESAWRETTAALRAAEEQQTVSNSTACIRGTVSLPAPSSKVTAANGRAALGPTLSTSSNSTAENFSRHRNAIRRLAAAAAEAEAARDEAATQVATPAAAIAADCAVTAQQDLQAGMRENAENAGRDLQVQETHLRLENAAAAERAAAQHQRHIKARQQLKEKHEEMQKIQTDISESLRPQHAAATAAYRAAQQQHTQMQQQLQQLQRRAAQSGASTAGRLAAIRQQIREAEQQQRLDEEQEPAKQQKRTELQRELEAAEAAAAEASAAAAAAAETVKQTTKQITSLREPLSDVVERLRQQQGKLSALLQQQISVKAKLQAATGQPEQGRQEKQKAQQQRHRQQHETGSGSICSSANAFWRLLPSDSAWSLSQVEALAEREGWKNANPKSAAGILANFVEVDLEYQRAVEAVGGFCFWHFVVPDSAHALEAVARLKQQQQQQQQQRGAMGLRPQRRCCLSLLPLKEVAEQQRQRQQLSARRKQQQQLAQQLLEQGVAMPLMEVLFLTLLLLMLQPLLMLLRLLLLPPYAVSLLSLLIKRCLLNCVFTLVLQCIRLSDAAPAASETSGELELFLRSVFGSVLLVPSLDSQEVSQWNQQGFDCVNLDGDIAFASGAMRGGGTKGGKLTAYFRMREAQKADEKLTNDLKDQQEALKTLQQEQKKLVEREQILSEKKLEAQLQVEAHVAAQQKANMYRWLTRAVLLLLALLRLPSLPLLSIAMFRLSSLQGALVLLLRRVSPHCRAHRAASSLLAVLKEEEEATAARILSAKQLQQTLRRETLQARPGALTSQEKQQLQQLHRQQQEQQQELQRLLRRVEETAAALSQAEDAVEVSLRRAVERLEREANEAEGEAWNLEATDRLQAEIESTSKKRQQEEENAAEVESRLRALENELAVARKSQETAEVSLQSLLQQLDGETALLQQTQHTVDSLKRMQADAASLVAAAAAAAGPAAAAAATRAPLAAQSREALHGKLNEIKEKLADFPHVNRKAVAELATIKGLLQQQLQQLQRRRQQLLQQLLRKVDIEFTSLFSQLVPGGHAKLAPGFRVVRLYAAWYARPELQSVPPLSFPLSLTLLLPLLLQELVQQDTQSPLIGAEASGLEIRANFRAQAKGAEERLSMQRLSGGALGSNNSSSSSSSGLLCSSSSIELISSSNSGFNCSSSRCQRIDVSEEGRGVGLLLLDEADSALDERHRRLLAAALEASSRSPGCQVILTTFRPELLDCGDRFLLVQQSQRASRLSEMQKADAQALLADMPRHLQDEALQLVSGASAAAAVAAVASTPQQQPQLQLLPLQG
ncbi:hypothetical protein Emag_004862 [Eimeria magna]